MSRFKGGDINLSPLKLQLTPDTATLSLMEWRASLQSEASGVWGRPRLSRPTLIGTTLSKQVSERVRGYGTATGYVISQFATAPSLPTVSTVTYPIKSLISYQWQAPSNDGVIVYAGGALLLYAAASAGAAWDGEMVWEEL